MGKEVQLSSFFGRFLHVQKEKYYEQRIERDEHKSSGLSVPTTLNEP